MRFYFVNEFTATIPNAVTWDDEDGLISVFDSEGEEVAVVSKSNLLFFGPLSTEAEIDIDGD